MKRYEIDNKEMVFVFDKPLVNYYKKIKDNSITHLKFGKYFNQRIDNLPNS
jgi:hypothetical protein